MYKKTLKRNKGITLIALVVTIIVLLILVGIVIMMLTGQNGILNRASEARDMTGTAQEEEQVKLTSEIRDKMLVIPQIMDPSVPIGEDDSCNVEVEKFGEPVVPDYEIPYHADIIEKLHGLDKESAGSPA